MPRQPGADRWVPPGAGIDRLAEAAQICEGCELHRHATQTVFGEGAADAAVVLVGEQPGDQEDRLGRPFAGPSGRLLDKALEQAGIDRSRTYVTNAVKHFKFSRIGDQSRRIHRKPGRAEVAACRPWLVAELNAVRPRLVVALGSTAAHALMGPEFRVSSQRGVAHELAHEGLAEPTALIATVHPSAVIRLRDPEREEAFAAFIIDLRKAAELLAGAAR